MPKLQFRNRRPRRVQGVPLMHRRGRVQVPRKVRLMPPRILRVDQGVALEAAHGGRGHGGVRAAREFQGEAQERAGRG